MKILTIEASGLICSHTQSDTILGKDNAQEYMEEYMDCLSTSQTLTAGNKWKLSCDLQKGCVWLYQQLSVMGLWGVFFVDFCFPCCLALMLIRTISAAR